MSHRTSIACLDCRKAYVLGDGSYTTETVHLKTLRAFDEQTAFAAANGKLGERARAHRLFLVEHEGHSTLDWNSDTCYLDDSGNLRGFYDDDLVRDGIGAFAHHELGADGEWTVRRG